MDSPATETRSPHYRSTLRILQRSGRRLAIRLEDIFWSQLREFAAEDGKRLSGLVFEILDTLSADANRTAALRCYCLDRSRRRASEVRLGQLNFDMLAIIAACPTPVIVLTPARRIAAFNPAFSTNVLKSSDSRKRQDRRPINLTFSEPLPQIYRRLLDDPRHISVYQIGVSDGVVTSHHRARFALLDRRLGDQSHLIVYLEP
jgi:predicted DNA-binding ribbon-helix-helix protein